MTLGHFVKLTDQGKYDEDRLQAAPRHQRYRATLLIVVVCTTYLSIPLVSGGSLLVPSFPTVALTPLLLLAVWRNISTTDIVFMFKVAFILVVSIALSPGYEHANQKFLGLIQCCMAIVVALSVVRLMQQLRYEVLDRSLLGLWLLVVIGSLLEVLGVLRDASDSFREWAYTGTYTIYDAVDRDINMVGWLRPKLFSVEPSHVTKFFIAAINSWLLIKATWTKVWVTVGATLIMLIVMGSPMLLVSAAITFAIVLWNRRAQLRTKVAMISAALIVALLFGAFYEGSRYTIIADRLSSIGESTSSDGDELGSEEKRVVYPYVTLLDTWSRWPLFGVGFSGKEVIFEHSAISFRDSDSAMGNNAFAETGTYLGLVGGLWFIYVMSRGIQQTGVYRLGLLAVIVALFSQLMGGIASFRYWGYIALFWGALAVADTREARSVYHSSE